MFCGLQQALVELRSTGQTIVRLVVQRLTDVEISTALTPIPLPSNQQLDLEFSHILQLNMEPSGVSVSYLNAASQKTFFWF